jgi:hypothetical protein
MAKGDVLVDLLAFYFDLFVVVLFVESILKFFFVFLIDSKERKHHFALPLKGPIELLCTQLQFLHMLEILTNRIDVLL